MVMINMRQTAGTMTVMMVMIMMMMPITVMMIIKTPFDHWSTCQET